MGIELTELERRQNALDARIAAEQEKGAKEEFEKSVDKHETGSTFGESLLGWTKRLPRNIGMGTYRAALSTIEAADDFFEAGAEFIIDPPSQPGVSEERKKEPFLDLEPVPPLRTQFPGFFEAAHDFADKSEAFNYESDTVTQDMAQFVIPFTTYVKVLGGLENLSLLAKGGRLLLAEGITEASAFEAQHGNRVADVMDMGRQMENRFGEFLASISPDDSLLNTYIEAMMTDRESETVMESRFKNAVDGVVTTTAISPAFAMLTPIFRTIRRARKSLIPEKLNFPENTRILKEGEAEGLGIEPTKLRKEPGKFQKSDARGVAALATAAAAIIAEEAFTDKEAIASEVAALKEE